MREKNILRRRNVKVFWGDGTDMKTNDANVDANARPTLGGHSGTEPLGYHPETKPSIFTYCGARELPSPPLMLALSAAATQFASWAALFLDNRHHVRAVASHEHRRALGSREEERFAGG